MGGVDEIMEPVEEAVDEAGGGVIESLAQAMDLLDQGEDEVEMMAVGIALVSYLSQMIPDQD